MKKPTFSLLAALAFGNLLMTQSCSNHAKTNRQEIPFYSGPIDVTIQHSNDTVTSCYPLSEPRHVNIDSLIRTKTNNALNSSNIISVRHLSTKLTLLNGSTVNNLGNFKSCYVSFYSNANTCAYTASVPHNPNVTAYFMDFPANRNDELKSYVTGNVFYYSFSGMLRRPVTAPLKCRIETQLYITVSD